MFVNTCAPVNDSVEVREVFWEELNECLGIFSM